MMFPFNWGVRAPAPSSLPACLPATSCYHLPLPCFIVGGMSYVEQDVKCPYCGSKPRKCTGKELYPERKKVWKKKFLRCDPCDAQVGCHASKDHKWKPFGPLADRPLRQLRKRTHAAFDPIWQSGLMTRHEAYTWMADRLHLTREAAHIGMLTHDQCERLIFLSGNVLKLAVGRK